MLTLSFWLGFSCSIISDIRVSVSVPAVASLCIWFACAEMDGESMYRANLKGPIGLVIGNEGSGVSRLVKESCDLHVAIPMEGEIGSLNASVAAGVLCYEIYRQRKGF